MDTVARRLIALSIIMNLSADAFLDTPEVLLRLTALERVLKIMIVKPVRMKHVLIINVLLVSLTRY